MRKELTQNSIMNTGVDGVDTGLVVEYKIDQSSIINSGNPNLETQK